MILVGQGLVGFGLGRVRASREGQVQSKMGRGRSEMVKLVFDRVGIVFSIVKVGVG